jgi:hypothetical protein
MAALQKRTEGNRWDFRMKTMNDYLKLSADMLSVLRENAELESVRATMIRTGFYPVIIGDNEYYMPLNRLIGLIRATANSGSALWFEGYRFSSEIITDETDEFYGLKFHRVDSNVIHAEIDNLFQFKLAILAIIADEQNPVFRMESPETELEDCSDDRLFNLLATYESTQDSGFANHLDIA